MPRRARQKVDPEQLPLFETLLSPEILEKLEARPPAATLRRTYTLTPEDAQLLEFELAKRWAAHGRIRGVDLSALVRDAIRKAYGNAAH